MYGCLVWAMARNSYSKIRFQVFRPILSDLTYAHIERGGICILTTHVTVAPVLLMPCHSKKGRRVFAWSLGKAYLVLV